MYVCMCVQGQSIYNRPLWFVYVIDDKKDFFTCNLKAIYHRSEHPGSNGFHNT